VAEQERLEPEADQQSMEHRVLFGADGLRAGWGLLLFGIVYGILYFVIGAIVAALAPNGPQNPALLSPGYVLRGDGFAFSALLLATWVMSRLEGRPFGAYGLLLTRWKSWGLVGAALGFGLLALLVAVLRGAGLLVFEGKAAHGAWALEYGVEWTFVFLLVALFEETLFRGYLQFTLARGLAGLYRLIGVRSAEAFGFWTSAVVLSFGFGAVHTQNLGESPVGIVAAGAIGVIFCLSLWRTGSLWWAIGFHAAWDWAQSFLFGVYDSGTLATGRLFQTHPQGRLLLSGGLTGPEGSVLVMPTLLVMTLAILITLPARREGERVSEAAPQAI
jgi:membrane protease YdiL (CAAX protease family)